MPVEIELKKLSDVMLAELKSVRETNENLQKKYDGLDVIKLQKQQENLTSLETKFEELKLELSRPSINADEAKELGLDLKNKHNFISYQKLGKVDLNVEKAYTSGFEKLLRKGNDKLTYDEQKALSIGSQDDGGYLVPAAMGGIISQRVYETSPMRELADVVNISSGQLKYVIDNDQAGYEWVGEVAETTNTTTPKLSEMTIDAKELATQPAATSSFIEDAGSSVENWLIEKISSVFSRAENTAFISGNTGARPTGILSLNTYAEDNTFKPDKIAYTETAGSGAIAADDIIKLFYSLKDAYTNNANFLMNRQTILAVRLLKDTTNQYLWQPSLQAGQPATLLGVPVRTAQDMPAIAAGAFSVALGDFKQGYQIVDRTGISILRDPFSSKPFIKFYTRKRVGGNVKKPEAIKLLKIKA